MNRQLIFCLLFLSLGFLNSVLIVQCQNNPEYFLYPGIEEVSRVYKAPYTSVPPVIDGIPDEDEWENAAWGMAQIYTSLNVDWGNLSPELPEGAFTGPDDFKLQYKILWDSTTYYVLLKIKDDVVIYSDHHAGYPGDATVYPFGSENFGRTLWNEEVRPAVGAGTGFAYDCWRMDHIHMFLTWNNPEFETNYTRNVQGVMHNFYPGVYQTTRPDTSVVVANKYKSTPAIYNPTAAIHLADDESIYIEFRDTTWSEILPGKEDFGPKSSDTLLLNMQINEADGISNRRDYVLFLSTMEGTGSKNTKDWVKLVLMHNNQTNVNEVNRKKELRIYPNPNNSGRLYLNREADVIIYNMSGQILIESKNKAEIDILKLCPGIFLLKVSEGNVNKLIVR